MLSFAIINNNNNNNNNNKHININGFLLHC